MVHLHDEAARAAYLAGIHAAQALISERTGAGSQKLTAALRALMTDWRKGDPRLDQSLRVSRWGYRGKEMVDYGVGRQAVVSEPDARTRPVQAGFVERIAEIWAGIIARFSLTAGTAGIREALARLCQRFAATVVSSKRPEGGFP